MSQTEDFDVIFEPFVGGRVYERASDGSEHEWGEVTTWDPPHRVEYLWHIFLEREKATRVTVTFTESQGGSVVRLVNSGFEVLGQAGGERMGRVGSAWVGITDRYQEVLETAI